MRFVRKNSLWPLILCVMTGSVSWAEEQPAPATAPIVAVFEIDNRGSGLTEEELVSLTDYLGTKLGERGVFQIIPRDEVRRRLIEQKAESFKVCYDQACQIEVGRELAAQLTVSASISRIGSQCLVTAALYDLRRAATTRTATAKGSCAADSLLAAVEDIVRKLDGSETAEGSGQGESLRVPPQTLSVAPALTAPPPLEMPRSGAGRKSALSAFLWSLIPSGGMFYVGKWGWGILYATAFIGGATMMPSTYAGTTSYPATQNTDLALVGTALMACAYLGSMLHSMIVAWNWEDSPPPEAGPISAFAPVQVSQPGRLMEPAIVLPIFSGRF